MPEALTNCSFSGYEADTPARQAAAAFAAECANRRKSMLLIGRVGAGKSHLAAAAFFAVWDKGLAGTFFTFNGLCDTLRATFSDPTKDNTYDVMMDYYKGLPVLVIDDLGTVKPTEFEIKVATEILNHRAGNSKLFTVVTTNLDRNQLSEWFGERVTSRLGKLYFDRFNFKPGDFEDYRERAW